MNNEKKSIETEIKAHKTLWVSKDCSFALFGKFKRDAPTIHDTEPNNTAYITETITEFVFYCLYLTILNITFEQKISDTQILVLASLMNKPMEFSLPIDSKDGKLTEIAESLEKVTRNSVYQALKKLRDRGIIVENEDKLIVLNAKLQNVRGVVKTQIAKQGFANYDYIFKCFIK